MTGLIATVPEPVEMVTIPEYLNTGAIFNCGVTTPPAAVAVAALLRLAPPSPSAALAAKALLMAVAIAAASPADLAADTVISLSVAAVVPLSGLLSKTSFRL